MVCTIFAVLFASVTYSFTKNDILTALAGTWGENIGFYGVIVIRDVKKSKQQHRKSRKKYTFISLLNNIKSIILEFGPAEVIDTFLSRPFMMYIFPKFIGNIQLGIIIGKIAADIICYIMIISSYEFQQRYMFIKSYKLKKLK